MARRKLLKIDEFEHRSGVVVYIFLAPDNTFVTNEILGTTLHDDTADRLKSKATRYLNESYELSFTPVIEIKKLRPFAAEISELQGGFVGFNARRFYYAVNIADNFFWLSWELATSRGLSTSFASRWHPGGYSGKITKDNFILPIQAGGYHYLPYSEEVWSGVMRLANIIRVANERLDEILNAEDGGIQRLSLAGELIKQALLGSGENSEEED